MKLRIIFVGLFFALILGYTVTSFSHWLDLQYMLVERGWNASPEYAGGPEMVIQVTADGPASILRLGDEVVAINGQNVERSDYKTENAFRPIASGDTYNITVRRDGELSRFCVSGDNQPLSLERRPDYATDPT